MAALFRAPEWEALEALLAAVRLSHLERLVERGVKPEEAETSRIIAQFLGEFFDEFVGIRNTMEGERAAAEQDSQVRDAVAASGFPEVGGTDYMEGDSGDYSEHENQLDA